MHLRPPIWIPYKLSFASNFPGPNGPRPKELPPAGGYHGGDRQQGHVRSRDIVRMVEGESRGLSIIYLSIFIYLCICTSLSLSLCLCIYLYIYIHIYICVCVQFHVHTYIYIYALYKCTCTFIYVYIDNIYIYIYICTKISTYMQLYKEKLIDSSHICINSYVHMHIHCSSCVYLWCLCMPFIVMTPDQFVHPSVLLNRRLNRVWQRVAESHGVAPKKKHRADTRRTEGDN